MLLLSIKFWVPKQKPFTQYSLNPNYIPDYHGYMIENLEKEHKAHQRALSTRLPTVAEFKDDARQFEDLSEESETEAETSTSEDNSTEEFF